MAEYNTDIFKQIEDVIDRKKETGEFDGVLQAIRNSRYAYSTPTGCWDERFCHLDEYPEASWSNEGDTMVHPIGQTDSEITVVRVKRENLNIAPETGCSRDSRIPGDGSHLLGSSSLANLVTLIGVKDQRMDVIEENNDPRPGEYLVQLSSWETETIHSLNIMPPSQQSVAVTATPAASQKASKLRTRKSKSSSKNVSTNSKTTFGSKFWNLLRRIFGWRRNPTGRSSNHSQINDNVSNDNLEDMSISSSM